MMKLKIVFCVFTCLALVANATVADETYSDQATWQAALTGETLLDSNYETLAGLGVLDEVVGPLAQPYGSIDFSDSELEAGNELGFPVAAVIGGTPAGIVFPANTCMSFNIDAFNGPLEGFGFQYSSIGAAMTVTLFDGASQVGDTFTIQNSLEDDPGFFGWLNCTDANVTRVEICPNDSGPLYSILGGQFSFVATGDDSTNQDKLQDIIDDLQALLPLASEDDQYWIDWAIDDLTCAQDPTFWETGDRLSNFGTGFFGNVFWATYDLECVCDDALVEESLIAIQDLLSCVVEAEIDFAMENSEANSNLIAYAEYFESYADAYSDAGLYLQAVLLNFYAWLFANSA